MQGGLGTVMITKYVLDANEQTFPTGQNNPFVLELNNRILRCRGAIVINDILSIFLDEETNGNHIFVRIDIGDPAAFTFVLSNIQDNTSGNGNSVKHALFDSGTVYRYIG